MVIHYRRSNLLSVVSLVWQGPLGTASAVQINGSDGLKAGRLSNYRGEMKRAMKPRMKQDSTNKQEQNNPVLMMTHGLIVSEWDACEAAANCWDECQRRGMRGGVAQPQEETPIWKTIYHPRLGTFCPPPRAISCIDSLSGVTLKNDLGGSHSNRF